jgi:hypothetical protein
LTFLNGNVEGHSNRFTISIDNIIVVNALEFLSTNYPVLLKVKLYWKDYNELPGFALE